MKIILAILIAVVLALQYHLWFGDSGLVNVFRLKKNISQQQVKNDEIVKQNTALASEINSLKKGGDAIESRARSDLGMVKKGEVFYQVVR